jgi:hypothetical protein
MNMMKDFITTQNQAGLILQTSDVQGLDLLSNPWTQSPISLMRTVLSNGKNFFQTVLTSQKVDLFYGQSEMKYHKLDDNVILS